MNRRFSLRRSDNYPFTGTHTASTSGDGSFLVTTGKPITSAHVSHTVAYGVGASTSLVCDESTVELVGGNLDYTFSPSSTVAVQQVELEFSRGNYAQAIFHQLFFWRKPSPYSVFLWEYSAETGCPAIHCA